jgi:ABC-type spermidine/putrescine transport system permease subunit II
LIVGPATFVLLVSFWLPWYSFGPISADGLGAHGWLFIAVLDSIVLVLYVLITAFGVGDLAVPGRMSKDQLLALITGVNLVLVALGFLLKPSGFSWSLGAFLALGAAVVAFLPFGVPLIRAQRQR